MITNERQYRITKAEADRFRTAVEQFDGLEFARQGIDAGIIAAQRIALEQQLADLEEDLSFYEDLRASGGRRLFASLDLDLHAVFDLRQRTPTDSY